MQSAKKKKNGIIYRKGKVHLKGIEGVEGDEKEGCIRDGTAT